MNTVKDIHVSVDVGCHAHRVAVGLSTGELIDEFDLAHRPEGFKSFFDRVDRCQRRYGGAVSVAMEGYNGWARPLDSLVRAHGYRLFNINNLKLARFKEIFPGAAKTDRIDARKALELFQLQAQFTPARNVLQELLAAPIEAEMLKRLSRRRRVLVDEKARVLSRLQADLQAVCPGLLEITADAGNVWFLSLLAHSDDLRKLARVRQSTLLAMRGVGRKYAAVVAQWQKRACFAHDIAWVGPMIIEDARRVLELKAKIKALQHQCEALINEVPMAQRIDSIPGFGPVCAAELTGEIGTIARFAKESSFALYLGMASLDHSSGTTNASKPPKHVNARAKAAMMVGVDRHRKQVPESQRYYEKKRAQRKSHNQAIRALGRHLCRVMYSMIRQDRPYELRNNDLQVERTNSA
jgi:transposase